MWGQILGGVLGQATKSPEVIKVEDNTKENIALYLFAAIVLGLVVLAFIKSK